MSKPPPLAVWIFILASWYNIDYIAMVSCYINNIENTFQQVKQLNLQKF